MAEDLMRYDLMAQDALRGVVRAALKRAARTGLPGDHHFFIAFDTNHSGVRISERLRKKYPEEMTIVLQHQFWGLEVSDDRFEVDLSFDNIPERLAIPFAAIKGFFDPSVQFGLQFEVIQANQNANASDEDAGAVAPMGLLPPSGSGGREGVGRAGRSNASGETAPPAPSSSGGKKSASSLAPERTSAKKGKQAAADKGDDQPDEAKVVKLDMFRKK
ncbi:SspB family protein [Rhodoligotrophos defluvii]|uniref:SspB family protein n=1 Tax=Rhodoligotrophos defluvii TaxID=2561934 RepID=UPI0010C987B7|nr:ClpXP protease specificity-enhancing factor SspB [Rhodoligotrophos defluvii]